MLLTLVLKFIKVIDFLFSFVHASSYKAHWPKHVMNLYGVNFLKFLLKRLSGGKFIHIQIIGIWFIPITQ